MKDYKPLLFSLLVCSLLLSGCWSQKEMTDLAIVSAMGIDLGGDGRYSTTLQVINPGNVAGGLQGGGGGDVAPVSIYSATGETLYETTRQASAQLPRRRYYAHTNLLVLGEELVRKEGIDTVLDAIERHPEFRVTAVIVIAQEGTASDLLKVLTKIDKIPANKIIKTLQFSEQQWGEFITLNLQNAIKDLTSPGKEPLITGFKVQGDVEKGKKLESIQETESPATTSATGLGVFKDGKLIDWINGKTARATVWILDKIEVTGVSIDWKDHKEAIVYDALRQNTEITAKLKSGKPEIGIQVEVEGNMGEVNVFIDLSNPHEILKIEKQVEKEIKYELQQAVAEAQKMKADVFGFGEAVYRSYPKEWKQWQEEWHDVYFPDLKVEINVDAYIRRTGLRNKPNKVGQES